jgi:hypothetical protein
MPPPRETREDERGWIFTFGEGHVHPLTNEDLSGRFVRIKGTFMSARQQMLDAFGAKWAGQYESGAQAGIDRFELTELMLDAEPTPPAAESCLPGSLAAYNALPPETRTAHHQVLAVRTVWAPAERGGRVSIRAALASGAIGDYAAYLGSGSVEWIIDHGDKLALIDAQVFFRDLQPERYRGG